MIVELRNLRKVDRYKAEYVRRLLAKGKIPNHSAETNGYLSYDSEELANYTANVKWGRPPKRRKIGDLTLSEIMSLDATAYEQLDSIRRTTINDIKNYGHCIENVYVNV